MDDSQILIGNEYSQNLLIDCINNAKKGMGAVIAVSGDTGYGKSHLLQYMYNEALRRAGGIASVHVECQQPVGNFNVGNLQPLLPFTRIMEKLLENRHVSPEKRFAMNVVMTTLASLPIAGDVFYAVKEMGKDYREFKKEKSSSKFQKVSSAAADYYDTLLAYTEKAPLALFLDDFHFADAQSVELIGLLTESISSIPIIIVFGYKKSIIDSKASPLFSFIQKNQANKNNYHKVELAPFGRNELREACKKLLPGYSPNAEFEDWIFDHSYGIPGIIAEYIRYFKQFNPFTPAGDLVTNFKDNEFLPATVQALFAQAIDKLTEEDKNILAVCSSEGKEFTATVVANLLNTDILTAIKKLRGLQNKTGIIKSTGASVRYGVKTTSYQFTQAFYHSFFENLLEYEEYVALHSQIAALLKQRYYETEDEETRRQIAPYLAAHSSVSGDKETAKTMLLASAQLAKIYGSSDIAQEAYQSYINIDKPKDEQELEENPEIMEFRDIIHSQVSYAAPDNNASLQNGGDSEIYQIPAEDFKSVRRRIINDYHQGNYKAAAEAAMQFIGNSGDELDSVQLAQLSLLAAKANLEVNDMHTADTFLQKAAEIVESTGDLSIECFYLNVSALFHLEQDRISDAFNLLSKAAEKSFVLSPELKLLTLTNIGEALKDRFPERAKKYFDSAKQLSDELNFKVFSSELA